MSESPSRPAADQASQAPPTKSTQGRDDIFELAPDQDLPVHPAAKHFNVSSRQLSEMRESLKLHGQMDAVTVLEDESGQRSILDGQTRNAARKELGVGLRCRLIKAAELGGKSALEWVIARNMAAGSVRHLSDSERALLAARLVREVYAPAASARMKSGKADRRDEGRAHEKAACELNLKPNRVRQALKVLGFPELEQAVRSGDVVISTAAKIAELKEKSQRDAALQAAKKKDKQQLGSILGQASATESQAIGRLFDDAAWKKQIQALTKTVSWLAAVSQKPEGRAICQAVKPQTLEAVIVAILASRPHTACPYCDYANGENCPVCQGSGWLTEAEHKQHIEAAMRSHHQRVAKQSQADA